MSAVPVLAPLAAIVAPAALPAAAATPAPASLPTNSDSAAPNDAALSLAAFGQASFGQLIEQLITSAAPAVLQGVAKSTNIASSSSPPLIQDAQPAHVASVSPANPLPVSAPLLPVAPAPVPLLPVASAPVSLPTASSFAGEPQQQTESPKEPIQLLAVPITPNATILPQSQAPASVFPQSASPALMKSALPVMPKVAEIPAMPQVATPMTVRPLAKIQAPLKPAAPTRIAPQSSTASLTIPAQWTYVNATLPAPLNSIPVPDVGNEATFDSSPSAPVPTAPDSAASQSLPLVSQAVPRVPLPPPAVEIDLHDAAVVSTTAVSPGSTQAATNTDPMLPVAVASPAAPPLPATTTTSAKTATPPPTAAGKAEPSAPPEEPLAVSLSPVSKPAIRAAAETNGDAPGRDSGNRDAAPDLTTVPAANPAATAPVETPGPSASLTQTAAGAAANAPHSAPAAPPLPPEQNQSQPLRSMRLDFTPDGSNDVHLHLSERAGDVHISVHTANPSLDGQLREGVTDLIGSLVHAGYDAEAGARDQNRRNQQQTPDDSERQRRQNSGDESFNEYLDPVQETA